MATLYFDFASPYAYLALARAEALFEGGLELQPVLLGAMFRLRGRGSWADTNQRDAGMAEVERRARRYGLPPLVWPPDWPCNSLAANRAGIWAARKGKLAPFAHALFRREFAAGADIAQPESLRAAAADAGLDPGRLADAITTQQIKDALRQATDEAWARGVRGVPTTEVGERLFFGDDHLEQAAAETSVSRPAGA